MPARRNSGCRLRFHSSLPFECRKADRAASSWQTTSSRSQDTAEELLRANAAFETKEGISGRGKPLSSRGAVKAISILRAPTQAVLQWRKRDPEGDGVSEAKSCTERDHVAFPRANPPAKGTRR